MLDWFTSSFDAVPRPESASPDSARIPGERSFPGPGAPSFSAEWLAELRGLPQPLHLLEFAVRSQHYHFGCFDLPGLSLADAQDRLILLGSGHFAPAAAVLDIGCGLGGTSRLLADQGLRVTGLEPCSEALAYAEKRGLALGVRSRPRYLVGDFEVLAPSCRGAFDGAIAIEILQHFPDLGRFFAACRSVLRPGGRLVIADVACNLDVEWAQVPYHRHGRLRSEAERAGFRVALQHDLTREILPTLPLVAEILERFRSELFEVFRDAAREGHGRSVELELDQLLAHMRGLQRAFEAGQLSFEMTVLGGPVLDGFPG